MVDANDMDLVREFACRNSETAFAELVRRHLNLVYSVALRFTGDTGNAQDVAQAVFIILARKAAGLSDRTVLTGWLYETTRFTALQQLRSQARRRTHEQEASMQSILDQPEHDTVWRQLAPHLEAAMSRLAERDRTLLALRYFQNKTGAEAAALLGIREEAARKQTNRALEKLRKFFNKRGVNSTTEIIAGAISANSVQAAPVTLAKIVTTVGIAKGAAASVSTLTLIKGALKIMAWTKAKTIVITIAVTVVLAASTTGVIEYKIAQTNRHTGSLAMENDLQPDGTVLARVTLEFINTGNSTVTPKDPWKMNLPIDIQRLTDEAGQPIRFDQKPGPNGRFEYSSFLNHPVPAGKKFLAKIEGTVDGIATGLIKSTAGSGVFEVREDGDTGTGYPVHRADTYRLPAGAVLLDKSPNLTEVTNGGRIEIRFDQLVSPSARSVYHFRYQLPAAGR